MEEIHPQDYRVNHLYREVVVRIKEAIILGGYNPENFNIDAICNWAKVRNGIICQEYRDRRKTEEARQDIVQDLSARYGMTRLYVEQVVKKLN